MLRALCRILQHTDAAVGEVSRGGESSYIDSPNNEDESTTTLPTEWVGGQCGYTGNWIHPQCWTRDGRNKST